MKMTNSVLHKCWACRCVDYDSILCSTQSLVFVGADGLIIND